MSDYIFYFETGNGKAKTFNYKKNEFKTMFMTDVYKLKKRYFMFSGYNSTEDGLIKFAKDFFVWVDEIKNNDIFSFDYLKYVSHESACIDIFKKLCHGKYEDMEDIDAVEFEWIEKCNNAGLTYCNQGKYDCYGYDFSAQYPTILACESLEIPKCRGKEQTITDISYNSLQVGYYNVIISSNDERFNKVFAYSKNQVYTHTSLLFAFVCQKEGYDVNINLVQTANNAYLYGKGKKDNIMKGSNIFCKWYRFLFELKEKFPKNKLVKALTSQLWGRLAQQNKLFKTDEEIANEGLDVVLKYDSNHDYYIRNVTINKKGDDLCELVNCKNPYKYTLSRIKPFLLAKSRYLTGKIAMAHIDDVIRIHTDNVTFNKQHDDVLAILKTFPLTKEDKTTGLIEWRTPSCYKHHTNPKFTTKNFKDDVIDSDDEE